MLGTGVRRLRMRTGVARIVISGAAVWTAVFCPELLWRIAAAGANETPTFDRGLHYVTTWVASSWPGGPQWFQTSISAATVLADGTVVTASPWDEAHRENTIYSHDGEIIAGVQGTQARAIAADDTYVYVRVNRSVGGQPMVGVARYFRSSFFEKEGPGRKYKLPWCSPAPFSGGEGQSGNEVYVAASVPYFWGHKRIAEIEQNPEAAKKYLHPPPQITGMASDGVHLYVAEDISHAIHVYDCETMKQLRKIPFRYPGAIAVARNSNLWVVSRPEQPEERRDALAWLEFGPHTIVELDRSGKRTGRTITEALLPTAIAVSPDGRRLLVADSHPQRMQVLSFDLESDPPN